MDTVYRDLTGRNEVLFIYTQRWVPGRPFEVIGSLGGLELASVVSRAGYNGYSYSGILPKVVNLIEERKNRLYAICLYCDFDNIGAVKAILDHFKEEPFYRLVGGPQTMHITAEESSGFDCDAILCGDGEDIVVEWLDAHRNDAGTQPEFPQETTSERKGDYTLLSSFDSFPYPDDRRNLGIRSGLFSVISARGCPHRCAFCFEGGNSKLLRPRPARQVLDEIRVRLAADPGLNYLFFADDTFTYEIKRLTEFCEGLSELRRERDFVWFCEGHASFFKRYPEALSMMVKAGLVRMQIGMESGCDEILGLYKKGIRAEDIRNCARLAVEAGLPQLAGNFIIGGAGETKETLALTKRFVLSLLEEFPGLLDISTTFPIPLSGTALMEHPETYSLKWLDTEFVTSLEDVPVNCTDTLRSDQICSARADFLHDVLKKMKELAAAGRIPSDRIKQNMRLYFKYGITDNWGSYIYRKDLFTYGYYRAVLLNGCLTWEQAKDMDDADVIPMATVSGKDILSKPAADDVFAFLASADGRSLDEIRQRLGLSADELNNVALRADDLKAVVYCTL